MLWFCDGYDEGFLTRVAAEHFALARPRPALENLARRKPRGLGPTYGESVQMVGTTAVSRVRLDLGMVPKTGSVALDDP